MKNKILLSLFVFSIHIAVVKAAIICPPDITVTCYDDITNLNTTGMPTVFGYPQYLAKYVDQVQNPLCNSGNVTRIWYVDTNYDNIFQSSEHNCVQTIYRNYVGGVSNVTFPADRSYTCKEDIKSESPDWLSGPCDMVGYNVVDQVFEVASDACYKILRNYTVINWCKYNGNGTNETWTHTQVIKVIDIGEGPTFGDCTNKIIGLEADCTAPFVITNSATDNSICSKQSLNWVVEIDLDSDGVLDYKYGYNEIGFYKLRPTKSGDPMNITLPGRYKAGHHTVTWFVRDQCGHINKCIQKIQIKDTKKPTPYLHDFLTASFNITQMPLMFPARLFNIGSFDNCTPGRLLTYSFSPNIKDSIKVFDCGNAGFQFLTIYVTDMAGNQEFVEVFLIAFDNGSCTIPSPISGSLTQSNGSKLAKSNIMLHRTTSTDQMVEETDAKGDFAFKNMSLYNDQYLDVNIVNPPVKKWDILDLKKLQNHILGLQTLVDFEIVAGDVDGDHKIRATDLTLLKNKILDDSQSVNADWAILSNVDTIKNVSELQSLSSTLDIMKYRGHADFKAVLKGDISDANAVSDVNPRSAIILETKVIGNKIEFYLTENLIVNGTQLVINLPNSVSNAYTLTSTQLNVTEHRFNTAQNQLVLLSLDEIIVNGQVPFLLLSSADAVKNIDWSQLSLANDSQILLDNESIRKVTLRERNPVSIDEGTAVYPNPSNGRFTLANDLEVLGIYDQNGQSVSYIKTHQSVVINVPNGVYFMKTIHGSKITTSKIFVIK